MVNTSNRPETYFRARADGAHGSASWRGDVPGFTLPTGLDNSTVASSAVTAADVQLEVASPTPPPKRALGSVIPSRVAYGRIPWDFLWHGTCSTDRAQWCLPAGHPRIDNTQIVDELGCPSSGVCDMQCPDPSAPSTDDQVKYDFELLLDFVDTAAGRSSAAVGSGTQALPIHNVGIGRVYPVAQRVALRIAPITDYAPTRNFTTSPPQFINGSCGAASTMVTDDLDPAGSGTLTVTWVEPEDSVYRDQHALMVNALANGTTANVLDLDPSRASFSGLAGDEAIFSIDAGAAGTDGEWQRQGPAVVSGGSIYEANSLVFASGWTPTCVTGSDYTIDATSWWAALIDAYSGAFPSKQVIGKLVYSANPLSPGQAPCYNVGKYVVGLRSGPHPVGGIDSSLFTGAALGTRFDSWGRTNILGDYPNIPETLVYEESLAWRSSSQQLEIANELPDLFSEGAQGAGFRYGVWDLEESVRYALDHHYSLFNFKAGTIPFGERSALPGGLSNVPTSQTLRDGDCDCYGPSQDACAVSLVKRLLTKSGFRVRLYSKSFVGGQAAGSTMKTTVRFANAGSAPPYTPYDLQFAFIDRSAFDIPPAGSNNTHVGTYPLPSLAPSGATLTSVLQQVQSPVAGSFDGTDLISRERQGLGGMPSALDVDSDRSSSQCEADVLAKALVEDGNTSGVPTPPADYGSYDRLLQLSKLTLELTTPSTAGDWMIVFRFNDASTMDPELAVPMQLPHGRVMGDSSDNGAQQRWYFYGYVTLQ